MTIHLTNKELKLLVMSFMEILLWEVLKQEDNAMFKIFGWMMFNVLKYSKILINALIPNGAPTIVILKVNVYTWIAKHNQDHSQHLYLNWKYI